MLNQYIQVEYFLDTIAMHFPFNCNGAAYMWWYTYINPQWFDKGIPFFFQLFKFVLFFFHVNF